MLTIKRIITATLLALVTACGDEPAKLFTEPSDAGEQIGMAEQGWATRRSAVGGRTWGVTEGAGQACILNQTSNTNCFFHGHNGYDTLDTVVKYWVNPQWTDTYDDTVRFIVDGFVTYAASVVSGGQASLPWSFQRLSGNTQPSGANVIIQAGYAQGTLTNLVSQYVNVDFNNSNCFSLFEYSGSLNGTYHQCVTSQGGGTSQVAATINVDFDSLEAYMFQQGFTNTQRTAARRHVLYHGMLAELGLGGVNDTVNSATRTVFLKNQPITSTTSSEELCRWRQLSDLLGQGDQQGRSFSFMVSNNTCP